MHVPFQNQVQKTTLKGKDKIIKKRYRILIYLATAFIVFPLVAYAVLRTSSVQTFLVRRVASYLSKELNTQVSVGGVDVSWFMNIVLEDVGVEDQKGESMVYARRMVFDVGRLSFRHKHLAINKLILEKAFLDLKVYTAEEELNFKFLQDYFSPSPDDTLRESNWDVVCKALVFNQSGLTFQNKNKMPLDQLIDYNNLAFSNFDLSIRDIFWENDTLKASIESCSFTEKSGFELQNLSGNLFLSQSHSFLHELKIKSKETTLDINIDFYHESMSDLAQFADKVRFDIHMLPSSVSLADVSYWVHDIYGMDLKLNLNGKLSGNLENVRGRDFNLGFGRSTIFRGNFFLSGLPYIEDTFINLFIEEFSSSKYDIDRLKLPGGNTARAIQLPASLSELGILRYKGELTGFYNDFVAYGSFYSDLGVVSSDILIRQIPGKARLSYKGKLATRDFRIGQLLDKSFSIGKIAMDVSVEGRGVTMETLNMKIKGNIDTIQFRDYSYRNIVLAGDMSNRTFNGRIDVNDPFLMLGFDGMVNMASKVPVFAFQADLKRASLSKLKIFRRAPNLENYISSKLNINFSGSNFDNLQGKIELAETKYSEYNTETQEVIDYPMRHFLLVNNALDEDKHELTIESDFFEAGLKGVISYSKFFSSSKWYLGHYLPRRFGYLKADSLGNAPAYQDFSFWLATKNTTVLTNLFLPVLKLSEGTLFSGNFNSQRNSLAFQAGAESFVLADNLFKNWALTVSSDFKALRGTFATERMFLSESLGIDNIEVSTGLMNDSLKFRMEWFNISYDFLNRGDINGVAYFPSANVIDASFLPSYLFINDTLWDMTPNNRILVDSLGVSIYNLGFIHENQHLIANGVLSKTPGHQFKAVFQNFNLSNFDWLSNRRKVDFDGFLTGEIILANLWQTPNVNADLLVRDFGFNHDRLGNAQIKSKWNDPLKAFEVDAQIIYFGNIGFNKPLVASGLFYPDRKDNNFDFDIGIENLKIAFLGRYLKGFTSDFRGLASGKLRFEGTPLKPALSGNVKLSKTIFRVDYLNTVYQFTHDIKIQENLFSFDNIEVSDSIGRRAFASGKITHRYFYNFAIDISLRPQNFSILNTDFRHNELFYGKAVATGVARFHGPDDDITMDISVKAEKGTQLNLPISSGGSISETPFITFIKRDTLGMKLPAVQKIEDEYIGVVVNFDLELTPDAEIQMIFDSKIGDVIRARGQGNLKMELNRQGDFNVFGDYIIDEGDYLFTLQNVINKRLRVEKGGLIRWTGDPYDADIDLKAVYRLRTPLYDLVSHVDTSEAYKRRIPVDCILGLTGKLFNPNVSFDIFLPASDEATREMVERLISTDQEMNRQIFSLLILNRFMSSSPLQYNTAFASGFGSTSGDFLSNQISNWLSQISSDVEIGVNIRPGDEITSSELELALSTHFWDDRITVDGNVGTSSNNPYAGQRASSIVGDVNVEVKITEKLRVKAFNRSNTYDLLNPTSPYTQGIGLFYRREFDKFSDLLRRRKKLVEE